MVEDPLLTIGQHIKACREELGLSIQDLSRASKVSAKYIEVIESGNRDLLPEKTYLTGFLALIFKALKLDKDELLEQYKSLEGEYIIQSIVDDKSKDLNSKVKSPFNAGKYFKIYQLYIFAFIVILLLAIGLIKKISDNRKYFKSPPKINQDELEFTSIKSTVSISEEAVVIGTTEPNKEKTSNYTEKLDTETKSTDETLKQENKKEIKLKSIKLKARSYAWLKVIGISQDLTLFEGDMMPKSNNSELSFSDEVGFLIVSGNAGGLLLDAGYGFSPLGKEGQRIRWFYPKETRKVFEDIQREKRKQ